MFLLLSILTVLGALAYAVLAWWGAMMADGASPRIAMSPTYWAAAGAVAFFVAWWFGL